jgi:hypothetical protein
MAIIRAVSLLSSITRMRIPVYPSSSCPHSALSRYNVRRRRRLAYLVRVADMTAGLRGAVNRQGAGASNKHDGLKGWQYLRDE